MGKKEELGRKISESLSRWKDLKEHGGSDPFWPDGVNMNLVRNHVMAFKRECESQLSPEEYPPEYHLETPPVVSSDYMARSEEIRANAKKSLKVYEQNPDYLWLKDQLTRMSDKQIKETGITRVMHYPEALQFFIDTDRLVDMRRHEDPENYCESFRKCREKVEKAIKAGQEDELPLGQLTMFDLGIM